MEEISNLNIAITAAPASGNQEIGRIAYLARDFDLCQGEEQLVSTVPELLNIVPSIPTFIYIRNVGGSLVLVDSVSTMDAFPQRVVPGGHICLSPETDTIYVKASDLNGRIWVMSVY